MKNAKRWSMGKGERKRLTKRAAAAVLSVCMVFTMMPTLILAETAGQNGQTGLCEHHTEHTAECGYQEGMPGHPCGHVHGEECYMRELICELIEDEEADPTATDSNAGHRHTEDCYELMLDCPHENGEHDESCGYIEGVEAQPCGYVCEICEKSDGAPERGEEETDCTRTEGCALPDGHEGECVTKQPDNALLRTITGWTFIDIGELNEGELALPGVNRKHQADFATVVSMLPTQIRADIQEENDPTTVDIAEWLCPEYTEDENGDWPVTGEYLFTAVLPNGYVLADGTVKPEVTVMLGGVGLYETGAYSTVSELNDAIANSSGTSADPTELMIDEEGMTVDRAITIAGKHVKLTGGTLTRGASYLGNLIEVKQSGSLVLEDITLDGNGDEVNATGSLVYVISPWSGQGSSLTLENGTVLRNNKSSGGGISLNDSGKTLSFTMNGGEITGNTGKNGGAIYESGWGTTTVQINGGSITGNTANGTDPTQTYGGAIYSNGALIITGGEITGNSVPYGRGGGIYKTGGNQKEFTITGGTVSGNSAGPDPEASNSGANVYVNQCSFTMGDAANIPDGLYLKLGSRNSSFFISSALENTVEIEGIYGAPAAGTLVADGKNYTITKEDLKKFSYKDDKFGFMLDNNQIKLAKPSYQVIFDLTGMEGHENSTPLPGSIEKGKDLMVQLVASSGYKLPATSVIVEVGGKELEATEYQLQNYSSACSIGIGKDKITGAVKITAEAQAKGSDATLSALTYWYARNPGDVPVSGFSSDAQNPIYNVVLPFSVAKDATIYVNKTKSDSNADSTSDPGYITLTDGNGTWSVTITSEDGTKINTYTVNFTIAADTRSSAKQITAFTIENQVGETVIDQDNHTIAVTMPVGTAVTSLSPSITFSDKAVVSPTNGTAQNFTGPVTYTVTAEDGTTQEYVVTVSVQTAFVAVTGITGVPTTAEAGKPLKLTGTVRPVNATNQDITWEIKEDGGTEASLDEQDNLTAKIGGKVTVKATIVNGRGENQNYTEEFTIEFTRGSEEPGTNGNNNGSSHSSGSGSATGTTSKAPSTTTTTAEVEGGSVTTTTTTFTDNSGKKTTVTTQVTKDTAGNVTGSTTTVTTDNIQTAAGEGVSHVTVRPDGSTINSAAAAVGATAQNPLRAQIEVPHTTTANELAKPEVQSVTVDVVIPNGLANNPNVEIGVTIRKETIQAAKDAGKNVVVTVRNENGTVEAVWFLDGSAMRNTNSEITDVSLILHVVPVQSEDPSAQAVKPLAAARGTENGLVLYFSGAGRLTAPMRLTVPATNRTGINAGDQVELYRHDPAAGTLVPVPGGSYTVDASGNVTIDLPAKDFAAGPDRYVLLPVPAAGTVLPAIPVTAGATTPYEIKHGDTLYKIAREYGCTVEELLELS